MANDIKLAYTVVVRVFRVLDKVIIMVFFSSVIFWLCNFCFVLFFVFCFFVFVFLSPLQLTSQASPALDYFYLRACQTCKFFSEAKVYVCIHKTIA